MISRILSLRFEGHYGQSENPLWQIIHTQNSKISTGQTLVPFENLAFNPGPNSHLYFQSYISLENLQDLHFVEKLNSGNHVQIWLDRPVSEREAGILNSLISKFSNLELVYVPDLHFHPDEIFKNLDFVPKLTIQLKTKAHSFDRWLTPFELWERVCWLKENTKIKDIETQVFASQLENLKSQNEVLFHVMPTLDNMLAQVKGDEKVTYFTQSIFRSLFSVMGQGTSHFLKNIVWCILSPTKENWKIIWSPIWSPIKEYFRWRNFKNRIIFYPFRKIYWTLEYQYKKRILGIRD